MATCTRGVCPDLSCSPWPTPTVPPLSSPVCNVLYLIPSSQSESDDNDDDDDYDDDDDDDDDSDDDDKDDDMHAQSESVERLTLVLGPTLSPQLLQIIDAVDDSDAVDDDDNDDDDDADEKDVADDD